jgi:hypothetical protein
LRAFVGAAFAAVRRVEISDAAAPENRANENARLLISMILLSIPNGL